MNHFKTCYISIAIALGLFVAGVALAQQAPAPAPTVQSTAEDANRAIGVLQGQRNEALDQAAAARIATAKVQAELTAEKKLVEELKAKIPAPPVLDGPTAPVPPLAK
jgi:hypothetical protein